ncbi:MAG TPA: inosine/xanthosine triphosphatase [Candidatus Thermoplasmatota archaeon]|nr:inosine/xanthosine triphosphatase [Candidatus Thermoplasmatota archaeon]
MRVCMGGTFDRLHRGHEALFARAFAVGTHVFLGVTSDALANRGRRRKVRPYRAREKSLRDFLKLRNWLSRATVARIDEPYGRALAGDYDAIVVSPETRSTAERLNEERVAAGRHPLLVLEVPHVLAADGAPVSASRIVAGEIDAEGRLLAPRIAIGSANPVKVDAVRRVARRAFGKATVSAHAVSSGVPEQPFGTDEIVRGASNRARAALAVNARAQLGVGVEAGLVWDAGAGRLFDVQHCVVLDRAGRATVGHGPGFVHPPGVEAAVKGGRTVGQAIDELAGTQGIGAKQGAIGFLSGGAMERRALTEAAVLMALLPRCNPRLYDP